MCESASGSVIEMPVSPKAMPIRRVFQVPSGIMTVEPLSPNSLQKSRSKDNFDRTAAGLGKELPLLNAGECKGKRKRGMLEETPGPRPTKVRATAASMRRRQATVRPGLSNFEQKLSKELGVYGSTKFSISTAVPVQTAATDYSCGNFKEAMQNRKDLQRKSAKELQRRQARKQLNAWRF